VIGVPKKRKLQSKLISFEKLPINIRQFEILKCFVNEDVARTAVHDKILINENYIEMIPDNISNKIIDELVAIDEVRCYFTEDGWLAIQQIVKLKKQSATWNCTICLHDTTTKSICCNRCLEWSHFDCVGINNNFKSKLWFCNTCKTNEKQ